jgi:hypothetical protein
MGFFSWFSAKSAARSLLSAQTDIHMTLADATRPFLSKANHGMSAKTVAQPAAASSSQRLEQRRSERNARRELLFQVVRESMVRVGVLSSAFKFKVLALDQRGQTFLVMIDLSAEFAGETDKLAEIEALISQSAKNRFDLAVQAVYWRFYDTVVSNSVTRGQAGGTASAPAPLFGLSPQARPVRGADSGAASAPAPLFSLPPQTGARPAKPFDVTQALEPAFARTSTPAMATAQSAVSRPVVPMAKTSQGNMPDPLDNDEVAAFKRALASGSQPGMSIPLGRPTPSAQTTQAASTKPLPLVTPRAAPTPAPTATATRGAPSPAALAAAAAASKAAAMAAIHNKLLLTGYEDTEMPDPDAPVLSATQYGDLH